MKNLLLLSIPFIFLSFAGCSKHSDPEGNGKVIILMYHSITEGEPADLYERSEANFEADLKYLVKNKIGVIGFDELEELVNKGTRPMENKAIITFDDGYHTCIDNAVPLLLKYEMEATFFIWASEAGSEQFLSWSEIDLMSHYKAETGKRPFSFDSHTMSHQFMLDMKAVFSSAVEYAAYLDKELGDSKKQIESVTPEPVSVLALPYGNGAGNEEIIAAARRNGYSAIRTSTWGAIDIPDADLFDLPSLPMLDYSEPEIIGTYLGIE